LEDRKNREFGRRNQKGKQILKWSEEEIDYDLMPEKK